jgi:hypothetical protein
LTITMLNKAKERNADAAAFSKRREPDTLGLADYSNGFAKLKHMAVQ